MTSPVNPLRRNYTYFEWDVGAAPLFGDPGTRRPKTPAVPRGRDRCLVQNKHGPRERPPPPWFLPVPPCSYFFSFFSPPSSHSSSFSFSHSFSPSSSSLPLPLPLTFPPAHPPPPTPNPPLPPHRNPFLSSYSFSTSSFSS